MKRRFLLIPLLLCALAASLPAAEYHTPNFTVTAADPELARQVGEMAEACRDKHARAWLGRTLPKWSAPCPVTVRVGDRGDGGATSFAFNRGQVYGWTMTVQGRPDRIVQTVIPHEVLHTILACHFRRPLPRWYDEGAATYEEDASEKRRQKALAAEVVGTREQIPIRQLLNLTEYPTDGRRVLVLYAQGFYLAEYLIDAKGRPEFLKFLETYFNTGDWDTAFQRHYGFPNQEAAYTAAWRANQGTDTPVAQTGSAEATTAISTPVDYNSYHIDIFTQSKCPPCNQFKTEELPALLNAKNLKVRILDLDKNYTWDRARQDGITGTPAFIVYKNEHRQAVFQGFRTADQLLAACQGKPETRTAGQGVGIGYFGPVGGQRSANLKNPHTDLNPAQLATIRGEIDARADVKINQAISANMQKLENVIDGRIASAFQQVRAELTPEQKALINATAEQKAKLDALANKIQTVEDGKSEFQKTTAAQVAALQKTDAELATQAQEAKQTAAAIESTVTGNVLANIKDKLPDSPLGWGSLGLGAVIALITGGPLAVAHYMGTKLLARRKEDEPTPAKQ